MGASQRRKGKRGELEVVRWLRDLGVEARRVPLSGAAPGYPGDVVAKVPGVGRLILQVKRRRSLPGWLGLDGADLVVLREDRGQWLVLMGAGLFQALLCRDSGRG